MLTEKHLAVVRAALKFLDEEMSPHGREALVHYFAPKEKASEVTIKDVAAARNLFAQTTLCYVLIDSNGAVVESERLIPASSIKELNSQSDRSVVASVLVPLQ